MMTIDARAACPNCSAASGIFCHLNCAVNRERNDAMIRTLASDARDNGNDRLVATCRLALKSKSGRSREVCAAVCADGYLNG